MIFENRKEAGKQLAIRLIQYAKGQLIVFGLPRGGVPVAFEVAEVLHAPLLVIVSQKIGHPLNPELGIGAVSEEGSVVLDEDAIAKEKISMDDVEEEIRRGREQVARRVALYRNNEPLPSLKGQRVFIVDDGLATGITAKAAIAAVKKKHPKDIVFASPVCSDETARALDQEVDRVVCVSSPFDFEAVGLWYQEFPQVSDDEVAAYLQSRGTLQTYRHGGLS